MAMMQAMVKLYLGITGLCGFLPMTDGTADMAAVCVNAEDVDGVHTHVADHFVGVLVHRDYYRGSSGIPDSDIYTGDGYVFLRVSGKRLTFLEASRGRLQVARCRMPVCQCPQQGEERCFDWVTPIRTVVNRQVRSGVEASPSRVSSVFELREGILSAGSLTQSSSHQPVVWEIDRGIPSKDYRRAMAESAVLYWAVGPVGQVETVTICLGPLAVFGAFDSGDVCDQTIVLQPHDSKIELEFKNQPKEYWFPGDAKSYAVGDRNEHYPHLNRLLAGDLFRSVPRVVDVCPVAECPRNEENGPDIPGWVEDDLRDFIGRTASNPHCPGADYSGP